MKVKAKATTRRTAAGRTDKSYSAAQCLIWEDEARGEGFARDRECRFLAKDSAHADGMTGQLIVEYVKQQMGELSMPPVFERARIIWALHIASL